MDLSISNSKNVSVSNIFYATARVGRDVIENAEYIMFNHSDWLKPKEPKTLRDKAELFLDILSTPFYKIKLSVDGLYWKSRYGIERMLKGYDSMDTFETFHKFIERYTKILTEYRKSHVGYVPWMTEGEWDSVIDEMLYHLHYMNEDAVIEDLSRDVPDAWTASQKTIDEVMGKHKDEFFRLFSKHFYDLWD